MPAENTTRAPRSTKRSKASRALARSLAKPSPVSATKRPPGGSRRNAEWTWFPVAAAWRPSTRCEALNGGFIKTTLGRSVGETGSGRFRRPHKRLSRPRAGSVGGAAGALHNAAQSGGVDGLTLGEQRHEHRAGAQQGRGVRALGERQGCGVEQAGGKG